MATALGITAYYIISPNGCCIIDLWNIASYSTDSNMSNSRHSVDIGYWERMGKTDLGTWRICVECTRYGRYRW